MTQPLWFLIIGVALWVVGLHGLLRLQQPIRRLLSINIMGTGVFTVMIALARRSESVDPVLQAMVVTGLVVAASATAFALRLISGAQSRDKRASEGGQ
ncbi:NADH-quinone oxidoreductase subunit K [Marinimicrobium sp. ARAG 43.8]|uniref:NADH-quinone oxidoreductase subunit K n=1 Tax=Marinimicrobium sp. ARAG 43.8 TaxID=3418719 RepID=UPI003CEF04BA